MKLEKGVANFSRPIVKAIGCVLFTGLFAGPVNAGSTIVRWERIAGINPTQAPSIPGSGQTFTNTSLGTISPTGFPWSTTSGRAQRNTANGQLQFSVEGLSPGANSPATIGTTGVITNLKGTLACHVPVTGGGEAYDTEAVTLPKDRDAFYLGKLDQGQSCPAAQMVFLLRVADVLNLPSPIIGLRLAHVAARHIQ